MDSQKEYTFTVEALGFYEDDQHCAVAVNMDIWGYGETQDKAFDNMMDLVQAQIAFAVQTDSMDVLDFSAEEKYVEIYRKARFQQISSKTKNVSKASDALGGLKCAVAATFPFNESNNHESFALA
jgi:hypothetical protein